jgi:hypothetical protein
MSSTPPAEFNDALPLKRPRATKGWLQALLGPWVSMLGNFLGQQAALEKLNRLLLGAVAVGFLVTIATYGWVVHQKFTLQQLIQETQALQESNTAHSIQLNRLQSFTGIMRNAQSSHWLSEPKETLTLLAPLGQPLPQSLSSAAMQRLGASAFFDNQHATAGQRWPLVTGY